MSTNSLRPRVDVHSHFIPPDYFKALKKHGHEKPDGMPAIPHWTLENHISLMERNNIKKSILSLSSPGVHLVPDPGFNPVAEKLARYCNSYASGIKKQYPTKFGYWASLPLPSIEGSLLEIETSISEGADGFTMLTNYHGHYLGDPIFTPIFEKLNAVYATIFIHPTWPCSCSSSTNHTCTKTAPLSDSYLIPMFEFQFDTARTVIDLFYAGFIDAYPNIRYILPHVGGCLPPILARFVNFHLIVPGRAPLDAERVRQQIDQRFWFDLAGAAFEGKVGSRGQLKALVKGHDVGSDRLLYGSDYPFTDHFSVNGLAERMTGGLEGLFKEGERRNVYVGNAERLLTRKMVPGASGIVGEQEEYVQF